MAGLVEILYQFLINDIFNQDHGTPEDPGSVLNFLHDVNIKQESLGNPLILNVVLSNLFSDRFSLAHNSSLFGWDW